MDRAYYKQLKQVKVTREKRRKQLIKHQRAQAPSLRKTPSAPEQNVRISPENQ
jgi:hypothetical protein